MKPTKAEGHWIKPRQECALLFFQPSKKKKKAEQRPTSNNPTAALRKQSPISPQTRGWLTYRTACSNRRTKPGTKLHRRRHRRRTGSAATLACVYCCRYPRCLHHRRSRHRGLQAESFAPPALPPSSALRQPVCQQITHATYSMIVYQPLVAASSSVRHAVKYSSTVDLILPQQCKMFWSFSAAQAVLHKTWAKGQCNRLFP